MAGAAGGGADGAANSDGAARKPISLEMRDQFREAKRLELKKEMREEVLGGRA